MNPTEKKIKQVLFEKFSINLEAVNLDSELRADLGFDSLDAVELIMELENVFKVGVSDEEVENLNTIGDIVRCFEAKL